jgi:plasmid stability protein
MSAITIRNLPDGVHNDLRQLAAAANLSVEALVRNLLADATQPSPVKLPGMADAGGSWGPAPETAAAQTAPELWGALRGSVHVPAATDLTASTAELWDAAT